MRLETKCLFICIVAYSLSLGLSGGVWGKDGPFLSDVKNVAISIWDVDGMEQFPLRVEGGKGSALIFVTHDCPISNAYAPELARLEREYGAKGFKMILVYVDPDVTENEIRKHREEYSLSGYTAVVDREHKLVRETGATITPEAVVILADGSIPYRGRIDNMYPNLGQRRRVITEKDLRAALDAVGENRLVKVSRTQAVGCYIPNI